MTDAELLQLIEPTLRTMLAGSGLQKVSVSSGEDHDGEQSLFVDVHFEGRGRPVEREALQVAMGRVRQAIKDQGEVRFPYLRLHIPDRDEGLAA